MALPCIASIVIENCALSECHDSVTRQHGMDLSTGESIYESWIDQNGLDHCANALRKRIVPGSPDESYVVDKIMGRLPCAGELSQPMPPPPAAPLAPEDIEKIRAWIAGGAQLDCSVSNVTDASADVTASDAALSDSSLESSDGSSADAATDVRPDRVIDSFACTSEKPCRSYEVCVGDNCGGDWECFAHYVDPPLEHPCPEELQLYCGCDGVTFEAQSTCPTRPYLHPGACGDGFTCDPYDLTCDLPAPTCADGYLPSIVDGCFGECVPLASCRCEYNWQCPGYQCAWLETRCAPFPESDAGDGGP